MLCKYCKHWKDKSEFGICKKISASLLTCREAKELYDNALAIATCDSEATYGELMTKKEFGCVLFEISEESLR